MLPGEYNILKAPPPPIFFFLMCTSQIILKQLFASGSVNISQYLPRLRRIIVKYITCWKRRIWKRGPLTRPPLFFKKFMYHCMASGFRVCFKLGQISPEHPTPSQPPVALKKIAALWFWQPLGILAFPFVNFPILCFSKRKTCFSDLLSSFSFQFYCVLPWWEPFT